MSIWAILGGIVQSYGGPVALVVLVGQTVGRAIPDSATGTLGVIRQVAKTIGQYHSPDLNQVRDVVVENTKILDPVRASSPIINVSQQIDPVALAESQHKES